MTRIKKKDVQPGTVLRIAKSGKLGGELGGMIDAVNFMEKPGAGAAKLLTVGAEMEVLNKPRRIDGINVAKIAIISDPSEKALPGEEGYAYWCDLWITCEIINTDN